MFLNALFFPQMHHFVVTRNYFKRSCLTPAVLLLVDKHSHLLSVIIIKVNCGSKKNVDLVGYEIICVVAAALQCQDHFGKRQTA